MTSTFLAFLFLSTVLGASMLDPTAPGQPVRFTGDCILRQKANKKSRSAQLTELTVVGVAEISSACSRVRAIDAEKEPFVKRPDQQYRIAETRTRENDLRSKKSNGKDKEERERLVTAVI